MNNYNLIMDNITHTIRSKNHILQDIFSDWWDNFLGLHKVRDIVRFEVNKFLRCGKKENGYAFFSCDVCNNYAYVPFTCKSRFCPSCGINKIINNVHKFEYKCLDTKHRHIVFTISKRLRLYFRKDRTLLNLLFTASKQTLLSYFKKYNCTPGIISVLHTFGRDLKWNPHIHLLITEGGLSQNNTFKHIKNIPFALLRKRFMTILLLLLSNSIHTKEFKKIKNLVYKENVNGFYVYAKNFSKSDNKSILKYITRYISRPVIAESRILNYDGNFVTFYYVRHEDNIRIEEKITALEFISKLIIHIPEKYFNMIRYYGIYSMPILKLEKIDKKIRTAKAKLKWIDKLYFYFNSKPLSCSCGNILKFEFIVAKDKYLFNNYSFNLT